MIKHAGGYQEFAAADTATLAKSDHEMSIAVARCGGYLDRAKLNAWITRELSACQASELRRRNAVACQEAMHFFGCPAARSARVTQQHVPPRSPQHQRRAETGRARARDHDVPQFDRHGGISRMSPEPCWAYASWRRLLYAADCGQPAATVPLVKFGVSELPRAGTD